MKIELTGCGIPFASEVNVPVYYKGEPLTCQYRADLIGFPLEQPVLIELKAVDQLSNAHKSQLIHYMKATCIPRALLMNFGTHRLVFERLVLGWNEPK